MPTPIPALDAAPAPPVPGAAGADPTTPDPPTRPAVPAVVTRAADRVGGVAHTGGTVILAAIGYALTIQYFRAGTPGVKAWLAAKFLNRVAT